MRVKSFPKRNIRLYQLKDCQKGFISTLAVKAISWYKKFNLAINIKSLVSSVKSDDFCIPVFGTGDGKLDFEIDLSSFVINDDMINLKDLESGEEYDWHKTKVDVLENVLSYDDSEYEDEYFEDFFDDWLVCSKFEKKSLIKQIEDFLQRDYESSDVSDIVLDRKNTIKMMRSLNSENVSDYSYDSEDDFDTDSDNPDFSNDFYRYNSKERELLLGLFELKLDFINTYLLSGDNWRDLSKGTFLSIREYMIEKERYEILIRPAKYFSIKVLKN